MKTVFRLVVLFIVVISAVCSTVSVAAETDEPAEFLIYYNSAFTLFAQNMSTGENIEIGRPFTFQQKGNMVALNNNFTYMTLMNLETGKVKELPITHASDFVMSPDWTQYAAITPAATAGGQIQVRNVSDGKVVAEIPVCVQAEGQRACSTTNVQWGKNGFYALLGYISGATQLAHVSWESKITLLTGEDENIVNYRLFDEQETIVFLSTPAGTGNQFTYGGKLGAMSLDGSKMSAIAEGTKAKFAPQMSAYGTKVVYMQNEQLWSIDVVNAADNKLHFEKLTSVGLNEFPFFSSKGNYISFLSARDNKDFTPTYMKSNGDYQIPIPASTKK